MSNELGGYNTLLMEHVVVPNRTRAQSVIAHLRGRIKKPIIDPAALELRGWKQDDYRELWRRVIETFVEEIVLLDGWEYSTGCIHEFLVACEQGLKMFTQDLTPMSPAKGRRLIESAWTDLKRSNHDSSVHIHALKQLAAITTDEDTYE
jgi:hypothetical protein